jgi:hypothetical protein
VFVLPNNSNIILEEQKASELTEKARAISDQNDSQGLRLHDLLDGCDHCVKTHDEEAIACRHAEW